MKTSTALYGLISSLLLTSAASAAIIQVGDRNIISQAGNPSDGLAYLDLSISDGLTSVNALIAAQALYADARLATPSEFDDLFTAAGILYDGSLTASDGFFSGLPSGGNVISSGSNYDAALRDILGPTNGAGTSAVMWTDPDGSNDPATTGDALLLNLNSAAIQNTLPTPPNSNRGWLIVTQVPEPSRALLSLVGIAAVGLRRRRA